MIVHRVACVVGARPNFMKMAPVVRALRDRGIDAPLVHTGQHYDDQMSAVFFDDLGLPRPDAFLGVGSASHAAQTAKTMVLFEEYCLQHRPDLVLVAGDVNSTLACALVAAKMGCAVGHVEAGLRSRDWTMPEEINRILTDACSDLLLTPSPDADANLRAEGVSERRIHFVGNCMIDSLLAHAQRARAMATPLSLHLVPGTYAIATLHRPANVDDPAQLRRLIEALDTAGKLLPVVFPVHPRTRERIAALGLETGRGLRLLEPLGYLQFLGLLADAQVVLTDSGGIQEETTALGVPCLTLRNNTERPITITQGSNTLLGTDPGTIVPAVKQVLESGGKKGSIPDKWDGRAAIRIAELLSGDLPTLREG